MGHLYEEINALKRSLTEQTAERDLFTAYQHETYQNEQGYQVYFGNYIELIRNDKVVSEYNYPEAQYESASTTDNGDVETSGVYWDPNYLEFYQNGKVITQFHFDDWKKVNETVSENENDWKQRDLEAVADQWKALKMQLVSTTNALRALEGKVKTDADRQKFETLKDKKEKTKRDLIDLIKQVKRYHGKDALDKLDQMTGLGKYADKPTNEQTLEEQRDIWDVHNEEGLDSIIDKIGYDSYDRFFAMNPGAEEALVDWIARMIEEKQTPEWGEKLGLQGEPYE